MKNRHVLSFFLAVTLLSMTFLMVNIPFVKAIEWSPENQLTTDPLQDFGPAIMQAGDGTVWVVWSSNRMGYVNYELFYKTSSDYGLNWSLDTRLTEDPFGNESDDGSPSIMQANNGTIWVVWSSFRTGDYELFYKTSSNNGASWSGETRLTNDNSWDTSPSIMQAGNGLIWVVWTSDRNGNDDLFYKTYNGASWSTDILLTKDSYPDQFPSIMQAGNGIIWVVWSSHKTGDYELFYKTFNGIVWSSPHQLTYNSDFDTMPSIAEARDGKIWVVWQSGDIAELYYKTYNGSAWSSDMQLTVNPASDIDPSIAQIDDKKIWVVWTANRDKDFDIYYKTSSEIASIPVGGIWIQVDKLALLAPYIGLVSAIVLVIVATMVLVKIEKKKR